ncbi:MAG: DHH family phosphoesterase [Phycisphaerae bacterium]|nr:DHH family phosphoesterase [Phycisphaerae bacterium]
MTTAPRTDRIAGWTGTLDVEGAARVLRAARSAVVVTHAKPDGDAAGSALALTRTIVALGADATAWFLGPFPGWLKAIVGDTPARTLGAPPGPSDPAMADQPDLIVVVDTGSWQQLGDLREWVRERSNRVLVIDHHRQGDPDIGSRRVLRTDAAAAAELVAPICTAALGLPTVSKLPTAIAEPLYLGMATDTGWFRFSNVTPAVLRMAADLLEAGADAPRLLELTEQQEAPSRLRLMARSLASLELHHDGRVALVSLSKKDLHETGGQEDQTSGFAEMLNQVATVRVAVMLTESSTGVTSPVLTKVSMRSKPGPGAVDVSEVTARFGGGGHARAAGARLAMPLAEAKRAIIAALTP